ncbi:MAG TPA: adenylosuccinate lyase [Clostridiales bacterium]|nr:adenylosuccinate lyase [Clostridiales bacterium]
MSDFTYESPFAKRWASKEMLALFSDQTKFKTWRKLWIALARSEKNLGLPITDEQIEELIAAQDTLNLEDAERREKEVRHDVMAHIYAYGLQCPKARGIIHLGATSCFVTDNTDILLMREGLLLLRKKLMAALAALAQFAEKFKSMPQLGFTHFQPAQLTTVGKRATLWMADLLKDIDEVDFRLSRLRLRGLKGTTGSQASFLELFEGDHEKVCKLEQLVAEEMGLPAVEAVTGQTYSRKIDSQMLATLSGIGQSASKFATDLRLLQSLKELEEPFERSQIGSSAMPYKRNPMRSERICGLARFLINNVQNAAHTASVQWLERTLDDSSNRRLSIAEGFLAADAILELYVNIASGLVVYPKVIAARVAGELPFMATENILMDAVRNGGDRQELHERIREHAMAAGRRVKEEGLENDLLQRIARDPAFGLSEEELLESVNPSKYIGRCVEQVEAFLEEQVAPVLSAYTEYAEYQAELKV